MNKIKTIGKFLILGIGIFIFISCNDQNDEEPAKYEVSFITARLGWTGLHITGPERTGINWVTGYNYDERFIYGKNPVQYFFADTLRHTFLKFNKEEKFKDCLARFNVEFKELIKVPILKVPDLSYGYWLAAGTNGSIPTYLELAKGKIWLVNHIRKVSAIDDYIIVEGNKIWSNVYTDVKYLESDKKWFAFHMPSDTKYMENSLDELSAAIKIDKSKIKNNMIEVYDYHTNKLPFKGYKSSRYTAGTRRSVHNLYADTNLVVRFIEYYKQENGYIFGKAKNEYFIFNTKNEICFFYAQKHNWLKKVKEFGLTPSDFEETNTVTPELDLEPWLKKKSSW